MLSEEQILEFWEKNNIFQKSLDKPATGKYVFYDGPPFATGLPHYGHILVSAIKDVVPRYQTMKGNLVERRWGWDCHGLPIENIVEKDLGISGKKDIEKYGIDKFNAYAQSKVLTYIHDWKKTVDRIGRWVIFDGSYKTMDNSYIESVWWALKQIHDKDLIYQGTRVLPYCPRCETPIANSEIAMDNSYKDISDLAVYVKLQLVDEPDTFVLVWTTTAWTLPGNTGAAVNPDIEYIKVKDIQDGKTSYYILAKERFEPLKKFFNDPSIVKVVPVEDLVGKAYIPPFDYYSFEEPEKSRAWRFHAASYVTTESGTGIVHLAPTYGEIDMELAKKENIPVIEHVNLDGTFKSELKDLAGLKVKTKDDNISTDIEVLKKLQQRNKLFAKEKIVHSYPHCFRCETPLYYTAIPAWFIKIQDKKPRLIELNEKINWQPKHLKRGRFQKNIETAPDWNISRNRFWATPLPIWKCGQCDKLEFIDSVQTLKSKAINFEAGLNSGELDLHRPYVDYIQLKCSCGGEMTRTPEVLDCWFESSSMPFARSHYPFENEAAFKDNFPAQFVAEYIAQTRTWFYYMHVTSTILFDSVSFENVLTTGTVLAEDGQKMSKSKGNFPDPWLILNKYGADALRFYLLSSPVMHSEDLNFSEKGVDEAYKKIILRLNNIFSFYNLYAKEIPSKSESKYVLDRWIQVRCNDVISQVTHNMDNLEIDKALKIIDLFIEDLSTWYLRRSRDRLKDLSQESLYTFYSVLLQLTKIIAPFIPFTAESIYQELKSNQDTESVHLESWPVVQDSEDKKILEQMQNVRKVVSLGLEARGEAKIKVRQPLAKVSIKDLTLKDQPDLIKLILDELNIKEVVFDVTISKDVIIDTVLTPQLREEGTVRDIIRLVQDARKKAGYGFNDSVKVLINSDKLTDIIEKHIHEIEQETLTQVLDTIDKIDVSVEGQDIQVSVGR